MKAFLCPHPDVITVEFARSLKQPSPSFLAPGTSFAQDSFSMDQGWGGDGFRMIQAHYIYCALYFSYYYISSTSDHQALNLRG